MTAVLNHKKIASIANAYGLELVYVFGSQVRGDQVSHSDLDVAVLANTKLSLEDRYELQQALRTALQNDYSTSNIDLVDLRTASPLLARQILQDGKSLFGSDQAIDRFYRQTIKRYIDTKPLYQQTHEYITQHAVV